MASSSYDAALARLLAHEGGYTDHPSDPGGPTNFGITIYDYRKYVKPGATAADVKAMAVDQAKAIYKAKYWDAQRCDELPAGIDYAVFDYGVNSGIGRSGKVLRRSLNLADDSSVVNDLVVAVAMHADAAKLVTAICDERLRFLKSLKTWGLFGKGWGRRVAEVRTVALSLASGAPGARATAKNSADVGKGVVPVSKAAQQGSSGAIVAAGAVAAQQAHQSGFGAAAVAVIVITGIAFAIAGWLFWQWRQRQQQVMPA